MIEKPDMALPTARATAAEPEVSALRDGIANADILLTNEIQSRTDLDGYYFSFEPTGNPYIDTILGAIGFAGKAYHHTADWNEDIPYFGIGFTCVSNIQAAANAAAKAMEARQGQDPRGLDGDSHDSAVGNADLPNTPRAPEKE